MIWVYWLVVSLKAYRLFCLGLVGLAWGPWSFVVTLGELLVRREEDVALVNVSWGGALRFICLLLFVSLFVRFFL